VKGNFDRALELVLEVCKRNDNVYLLNSINPFRVEGQKTLAYEVCDQLGKAPDYMVMPVGNAGNISSAWKGFSEFYKLGLVNSLPRMIGVQAEGASPIYTAFKNGSRTIRSVPEPETVATAIRIGAPVSWKKALNAIYDSNGSAEVVTDQEILESQNLLARLEGLFVEPASASPIAALRKLVTTGRINRSATVVCVATGNGLKDPDIVGRTYGKPIELEASVSDIERFLRFK